LNYPESVQFLYALGNEYQSFKLGLENISILASALGDPQRATRVVHVAGTNGKGSTCAMIESALRASGLKTGLYTSPHLVEPTERIQIAGKPVTHEQFSAAFDMVHAKAEELVREGRLANHPTYFETVTMMGFVLFRDLGVDIAVVEVGLGGRLDATNIVEPELCVITPIDFDHERWLGNSLEAIAGEKAGILKPGVPAVFSAQRPEAERVLREKAAAVGAWVFDAREAAQWDVQLSADGMRFKHTRRFGIEVDCPLAGEHQLVNAATAITALEELGVEPEAIREGLRSVQWPGRLETVGRNPRIVLDGAHNPAGARALAQFVDRFYPPKEGSKRWAVYGAMRDKSVQEITEILFPAFDELVLTAPDNPRAVRPEVLAEEWGHRSPHVTANTADALRLVREKAGAEDTIFITGSLFVVGEARGLLLGREDAAGR
jgi:dihydrofolate synthase / folylpolyglutamate synthase